MSGKQKVILVGVDGATWDLIHPLREKGQLPTFDKLIEEGVRATLNSLESTYTPLIWPTISTGKKYHQWNMIPPVTSRSQIDSLTIWDILEESGYDIGIINWQVTWPPRETRGFYIPGEPASSPDAYPAEYSFLKRLKQLRDGNEKIFSRQALHNMAQYLQCPPSIETFREFWRYLKTLGIDEEVQLAQRSILSQSVITDVFVNIYKRHRPDFAAIYLGATDITAHTTWKYYEPNKFPMHSGSDKYANLIPNSYISTDRCLRRILDISEENTTVLVVSDHGIGPSTDGTPRVTPNVDSITDEYGTELSYSKLRNSVFFFSKDADELSSFEDWLAQLNVDGTPIFRTKRIHKTELRVSVRCDEHEPSHSVSGTCRNVGDFVEINQNQGKWATHRKNGIFIASGPGLQTGIEVDPLHVTDVTPTLLHYLNEPVGKDMDGNVRKDIMVSELGEIEPDFLESYDEQPFSGKYLVDEPQTEQMSMSTKQRLKKLGYL